MNLIARFLLSGILFCAFCSLSRPARAESFAVKWPQPDGVGTDVFITYSYSNLLDGNFLLLSSAELRAATEEALALWTSYAPLHFIEQPDSGPLPSDVSYAPDGHPQIRIGHHLMPEIAHAFFPSGSDGLAGDVHVDSGIPWTLDGHWNFLEAITHELGHALGLPHEMDRIAIMNPFYPQQRFTGLGSGFLFQADIDNLQALYGAGRGSVQSLEPIPEPAALILVATGLAALARARRRR